MQELELYEFLVDTFAELTALNVAAASTIERARSVLVEHDEIELPDICTRGLGQGTMSQNHLLVNPGTFTVQWNGQRCPLGPTILFRLIQCLARRPGRYFTSLLSQRWHNEDA